MESVQKGIGLHFCCIIGYVVFLFVAEFGLLYAINTIKSINCGDLFSSANLSHLTIVR